MTPQLDGVRRRGTGLTLPAIALGAVLVYHIGHLSDYRQVFSDYVQDYLSARSLFAGGSIYAPLNGSEIAPGSNLPDHPPDLVNDHPPQYIIAFAPLAAGGYGPAFGVLELLILASYTGIGITTGLALGYGPAKTLLLAAVTLMHPGVGMGLWAANPTAIIGLLTVLGWAALRHRADRAGGVALGLAAGLKLYPGLVIVGLVTGRRWAAAGGFVAAVAGTWAVATLVVGLDDSVRYITERMTSKGKMYAGHAFNLSIPGVGHRLFGPPSVMSPWLGRVAEAPAWSERIALGGTASLVAALFVRLLSLAPASRSADRTFALIIPGMLLLSPLTWLPSVPVVTPVIVMVAADAWRHGRTARLAAVVGCGLLLFVDDRRVAEFVLNGLERPGVSWQWNLVMLAPTWGLLGTFLLGCFGWRDLPPPK